MNQNELLEWYYDDNAKRLRVMVDLVLHRLKFHDIDPDDFYSLANEIFVDVLRRYDGKQDFNGFLYSCLCNKFKTEMTRRNREKRKADRMALSWETPIGDEDGGTIGDVIANDDCVEEDVIGDITSDKVDECLNNLPKIQKEILQMKMQNISVEEIKEKLELSDSQYSNHMKAIMENRSVINFKKNRNNTKKVEVNVMKNNNEETMQVMDIDTTDSYRRDNNTLGSLLDDISDELSPTYINRDYISQRQPFMWSEEQINKFYARILNNQPIPEIIICEQIVDGRKISFLIDGLQRLSYAELFKSNMRTIKAKGAEFTHIKYRKRVVGEDGKINVVEEIFDIVGKKYEDLPEFLQKRFDNFNVTVTRFFNCTSEMIDYHIRNYNSHTSMNKVQYGITNVSNVTAGNIKAISQGHSFFKNMVSSNNKKDKDGSWDEVVARAIMTMNFIEDWKCDVKDVFVYLDENATTEQFDYLRERIDRMNELVEGKGLNELFTTGNTHIWLTLYDKFTKLGLDDEKFIDFMKKFKDDLHSEEPSDFIKEIYKSRQTKDRRIVVGKIDTLWDMLLAYVDVDKEDTEEVDCKEFVIANVEDTTDEDVEDYEIAANIASDVLDMDSWMLSDRNRPSYLAIVGYAYKMEEDDGALIEWLPIYVANNQFNLNQQESFLHMKQSFETYLQKGAVA